MEQTATDKDAQREARRRRILENSENRLNAIAGKLSEDTKADVINKTPEPTQIKNKNIVHEDPEIERDIFEHDLLNQLTRSPNRQTGLNKFAVGNQNIFELLDRLKQQSQQSTSNSFSQETNNSFGFNLNKIDTSFQIPQPQYLITKTLRSKIQLALIGVLTYLLLVTKLMISANVFTIFLLWELAEVFLLKTYDTKQSSVLTIFFLIGGIPPTHSAAVLKTIETLNKILKDVAIFLFFFVLTHISWHTIILGDNIQTITMLK